MDAGFFLFQTIDPRRMKQIVLILFAAVIAAVVPRAHAEEPLKLIRIGVATGGVGNPVRVGGAPAAIVYTHGLLEEEFKKDGVKVDWIFFKGAGPAVNEALVNHQLDFAWQGDLPSIVHRTQNVKTRIILASGVRNGLYLAVPPDSSIKTIEDLKGKRVAVWKGTNLHLAAVRVLAAHGLKEANVKLINLDLAGAQAALSTHDIDAAFGYIELFVLRDKGIARIIYSAREDSYRYTRQTALLVTDEFASRYPEAVDRVVRVSVKAARQYSDESRRDALFAEWGKAEVPEKYWREDFLGEPLRTRLSPLLDPFLVARYKDAYQEALNLKLVRGKADIDSWFDRRFLGKALREEKLDGYWPEYQADGKVLGSRP